MKWYSRILQEVNSWYFIEFLIEALIEALISIVITFIFLVILSYIYPNLEIIKEFKINYILDLIALEALVVFAIHLTYIYFIKPIATYFTLFKRKEKYYMQDDKYYIFKGKNKDKYYFVESKNEMDTITKVIIIILWILLIILLYSIGYYSIMLLFLGGLLLVLIILLIYYIVGKMKKNELLKDESKNMKSLSETIAQVIILKKEDLKDEVVKSLQSYLIDYNVVQKIEDSEYILLLNGGFGTGKTYYIDNVLNKGYNIKKLELYESGYKDNLFYYIFKELNKKWKVFSSIKLSIKHIIKNPILLKYFWTSLILPIISLILANSSKDLKLSLLLILLSIIYVLINLYLLPYLLIDNNNFSIYFRDLYYDFISQSLDKSFDVLVFEDLDRLSKNQIEEMESILYFLKRKKIKIIVPASYEKLNKKLDDDNEYLQKIFHNEDIEKIYNSDIKKDYLINNLPFFEGKDYINNCFTSEVVVKDVTIWEGKGAHLIKQGDKEFDYTFEYVKSVLNGDEENEELKTLIKQKIITIGFSDNMYIYGETVVDVDEVVDKINLRILNQFVGEERRGNIKWNMNLAERLDDFNSKFKEDIN